MSRATFAFINRLSLETTKPEQAYMAMRNLLLTNIKLSKSNSQVNLMRRLAERGLGTRSVETFNRQLNRERRRQTPDNSFINFAMKKKVSDAEWWEQRTRKEFYHLKGIYRDNITENSFIDLAFHDMMDKVLNNLWHELRQKNKQKIEHLHNTWRRAEVVETDTDIRGVKFRDVDLQVDVNDKNPETVLYGGVEVSDDVSELLRMNPKMMTYEKIDPVQLEIEISKGITLHH